MRKLKTKPKKKTAKIKESSDASRRRPSQIKGQVKGQIKAQGAARILWSKACPPLFSKKAFEKIYAIILKTHSARDLPVEVLFTENNEIQKLNRTFRKKNKATDVLSFPSSRADLLGSIALDLKTAKTQAKTYKHSLERECLELFVHGVHHLLGFDHEDFEEATLMKKWEKYFESHLDRIRYKTK